MTDLAEFLHARLDEDEQVARGGDGVPLLKALALPYAAHPDYDERWKP